MIICVVAAEKLEPRSADEFVISGRFIDDDRLMDGSIAADGESQEGADDRENVFEFESGEHFWEWRFGC